MSKIYPGFSGRNDMTKLKNILDVFKGMRKDLRNVGCPIYIGSSAGMEQIDERSLSIIISALEAEIAKLDDK